MSDLSIDQLVNAVRSQLATRSADPFTDEALVRTLAQDAVDGDPRLLDADQRSLTIQRIIAEVSGLGPLQAFLEDPHVEEIWVNSPTRIFVARNGVSELTTVISTDEQVRDLVERMLVHSGRRLDLSQPFVDATLRGGERLHVVIPPVANTHWSVNIRKHVQTARSLEDLEAAGMMPHTIAKFLKAAVASGLSILVSGATQAGKTTLLRALAGEIPRTRRVITCEEVFELSLPLRDCVALQTRPGSMEGSGEVTLRDLVRETLRMRPECLIVGEVRGPEALDLLLALNAGVPGMATLHANSAREALSKLCLLPLLAGENVTPSFVVPTVAGALDLACHVQRDTTGKRYVAEVIALSGRIEGTQIETSTLWTFDGDVLTRGNGNVEAHQRFAAAGFDLTALLQGGR